MIYILALAILGDAFLVVRDSGGSIVTTIGFPVLVMLFITLLALIGRHRHD